MSNLKPITVLLTASGCPGASTCIRYLKNIKERKVRVVGVDAEQESIGNFLADVFYQLPMADESHYIEELLKVAIAEQVDCILVSSSYEIEVIAQAKAQFEAKGIKVLASSPEAIKVANNKQHLYQLFQDHPQVKVPPFLVANSLAEFISGCESMGYPKKSLCFKPPHSKGSRGFRILSEKVSRKELLLNHKPESKYITLSEFTEIFQGEKNFPELIVMETLEGEEIDSMVIALAGEPLLITHKTREKARGGVITHGGHCSRPELDHMIQEILSQVRLSYNIGLQFIDSYLLEINPRLSTFIYQDDWVEPYFAIKLALGEYSPQDIKALQSHIPQKLRMLRYFDQHFYQEPPVAG